VIVFGCHVFTEFMPLNPYILVEFAGPIALGGGMIASPIVGIRLMIRKGVTWKRLLGGIGVGFLLFLGFAGVVIAAYGFPSMEDAWYVLPTFFTPAIVFAGLVRWNAWACDVATGVMFQKT
jgi:hypothetical protein